MHFGGEEDEEDIRLFAWLPGSSRGGLGFCVGLESQIATLLFLPLFPSLSDFCKLVRFWLGREVPKTLRLR